MWVWVWHKQRLSGAARPFQRAAALSRGCQARDFPLFLIHLLGGLLGLDLDFGSAVLSPVCAHALSMPFSSCCRETPFCEGKKCT